MDPLTNRTFLRIERQLGPFGLRRLCLALADNRNLRYLACEFDLRLFEVRVIDQWLPAAMAHAVRACERAVNRRECSAVMLRFERPAA